jgi:hypothetical protein
VITNITFAAAENGNESEEGEQQAVIRDVSVDSQKGKYESTCTEILFEDIITDRSTTDGDTMNPVPAHVAAPVPARVPAHVSDPVVEVNISVVNGQRDTSSDGIAGSVGSSDDVPDYWKNLYRCRPRQLPPRNVVMDAWTERVLKALSRTVGGTDKGYHTSD